jgi:capsular exopolysaccharide synthesis family protein
MRENHEAPGGSHNPDSQGHLVLMNNSRQLSETSTPELIGLRRPYGLYDEMRLLDLWDILVRRKKIVLATLLTSLLAGALICVFWTRRYMATAELQVGRETENNLGLQTDGSQEPPADSLAENITLQTQSGILQSDTLALKVINALSLESTQDFRPKFNPIEHALRIFALDGPPDPSHATLEESPRRRARVLDVFRSNLAVKPIAGTRLIEISYSNPDPKLAALVVNHLANSLVDYNFQIRHEATSHTTEWLAGQMSDLRQQSEDLQAKVAELQRESGVFSLGETDAQGREQVYSSVLDKLQQATTALSQAQANRIGKAAIFQIAQTGDPEAISQLSGSSIFASSSGLESSLSLIQSMRMQEATLRGQLGEMAAKFGPAYPKLGEMRGSLDALSNSIHAEVNRVAERAKNDYDVAHQVESAARKIYLEQKHQADLVNDKTIEYVIARKEAEESRNLYESLFRQLKQSGVLAGFRANNISLVDPARVPAKPAQPKLLLYMAAALAGGLFLGACGALVKDRVDTRIHNPMLLESDFGQIPLGMLPYYKPNTSRTRHIEGGARPIPEPRSQRGSPNRSHLTDRQLQLPAIDEPSSAFVEALRALRTSLLLSKARTPPQVILITSSMPSEGKSMLSANFAAVLAGQRKKVLLVDADLRHPNLHHALSLTNDTGLSWLLAPSEDIDLMGPVYEKITRSIVVPVTDISHLYFVPSGPTPEHPAELLSSDRMRRAINIWRGSYDYIVIDGSPVLSVTDSVILSGLVDFTLLTARYQVIEQQALRRAYGILRSQADHNNIGIVLNAVQKAAGAYYPAYGSENSRPNSNIRGFKRETA